MVEMALILPLLMALLFGIIEFGWMLRTYQAVGQAAREGARSGALGSDTGTIDSRVVDTARDVYQLDPARFGNPKTFEYRTYVRSGSDWVLGTDWTEFTSGNPAAADAANYSQIRVTLTYNYPLITGGLFSWLNGGNNFVTLKQSIVMRKE